MKQRPTQWLIEALILLALGGLAYVFGQALRSGDWLAAILFLAVIAMCLTPLIVLALFDD